MRFTKLILKPDDYNAQTLDGPKETKITKDRLATWVDTFSKMTDQENPLRIPAPWKHDGSSPLDPDDRAADNNAGFWEELWQEPDGSVYGTVDIPRDEDASRVGTTVREVSPYILPEYTDGLNRTYKEGPLHIALVTHPVMPGQTNFEKVRGKHKKGTPALALAMSQRIFAEVVTEPSAGITAAVTNASEASVKDAVQALSKHGISLPQDTTAKNLVERLMVAIQALDGKKEDEDQINQVPQGQGTEQPLPIAMGDDTMKVTVSKDGKALEFATAAEREEFQTAFKGHEDTHQKSEALAKQALAFAGQSVKQRFISHVEALVDSGRIPPVLATEKLKPMIDAYEFSLGEDGKQTPRELDRALEILEALPENATGFGGLGRLLTERGNGGPPKKKETMFSFEQELPEGYEHGMEMSDEEVDKIADRQMTSAGLMVPAGK